MSCPKLWAGQCPPAGSGGGGSRIRCLPSRRKLVDQDVDGLGRPAALGGIWRRVVARRCPVLSATGTYRDLPRLAANSRKADIRRNFRVGLKLRPSVFATRRTRYRAI